MQDGTENRMPKNDLECPGRCDSFGMCWYIGTFKVEHLENDILVSKRIVENLRGSQLNVISCQYQTGIKALETFLNWINRSLHEIIEKYKDVSKPSLHPIPIDQVGEHDLDFLEMEE